MPTSTANGSHRIPGPSIGSSYAPSVGSSRKSVHRITTALASACTLFITNDADFRRVQGLPIIVLDDLLCEEGQA